MTEQPEPDELERVRQETARKIALEAIAVAREALKSARASGPMEIPTQEPQAPDSARVTYPRREQT